MNTTIKIPQTQQVRLEKIRNRLYIIDNISRRIVRDEIHQLLLLEEDIRNLIADKIKINKN